MATKYIKIRGKIAWAKSLFNADDTPWGTFWSIEMYPDEASKQLMKEHDIGLRPVKKPFFEGEDGYKFRRPTQKNISGKMVDFERPQLMNADGGHLDLPESVYIGNGSVMELDVAVYQTLKGTGPVGHRLEKAKLLELVEYKGAESEKVEGATKTAVSPATKKPW